MFGILSCNFKIINNEIQKHSELVKNTKCGSNLKDKQFCQP